MCNFEEYDNLSTKAQTIDSLSNPRVFNSSNKSRVEQAMLKVRYQGGITQTKGEFMTSQRMLA